MKIGLSQLKTDTPKWATWTFRIIFVLTTCATFIIAGDDAIPNDLKVRLGVYLKALDMAIYSISKIIGVDAKNESDLKEEKN